jgi:hypothetical protein
MRNIAKATGVQPLRDAIMTILCLKLEEILGGSKLPKPPKPGVMPPSPARCVVRLGDTRGQSQGKLQAP